jgi:hypothetical protein
MTYDESRRLETLMHSTDSELKGLRRDDYPACRAALRDSLTQAFELGCHSAEPVPPSPQPGTPLSLEQAVAVLNEQRHRIAKNDCVVGVETAVWFTNHEAIAIAEKYLRDGNAPDATAQEGARDGRS